MVISNFKAYLCNKGIVHWSGVSISMVNYTVRVMHSDCCGSYTYHNVFCGTPMASLYACLHRAWITTWPAF